MLYVLQERSTTVALIAPAPEFDVYPLSRSTHLAFEITSGAANKMCAKTLALTGSHLAISQVVGSPIHPNRPAYSSGTIDDGTRYIPDLRIHWTICHCCEGGKHAGIHEKFRSATATFSPAHAIQMVDHYFHLLANLTL